MNTVNNTAAQAKAAATEPLTSLPDFDERVVLLRRFSLMFAGLVEDLHLQASQLGISAGVLEPFAQAASALGAEVPEALIETSRRIRTTYADVIEKAEAGVDLRFFNHRGAA